MSIEKILTAKTIEAVNVLYNTDIAPELIQLQATRKEFDGDKTLVVFPFVKASKKNPELTANELGAYLLEHVEAVTGFNVIKGFLNLSISQDYWTGVFNAALADSQFGFVPVTAQSKTLMVEYSSPNTNKPLHLGHIRNNLLGFSIAQILSANGYNVLKVNLVNDRGIHICKSMLAWQKFGNGETPQSSGKKGDHLVGEYYVKFDIEYKTQIQQLMSEGKTEDEAKALAPIMEEAREMLRLWEAGDTATVALWKTMNGWVYEGFDKTYARMGVAFDKIYYESETYLLGKRIVQEGLAKGVLFQKEDGSIWADLIPDGLDQKLLLRPDGTSVYMTQDIGTAVERFEQYGDMQELIYVVGNEQNYHFQVLSLILSKLGYAWASKIYHMSYGMVELPEGKMKSREGKVVDADDLMEDMVQTAAEISRELGKLDGYAEAEAQAVYETIAMGALKYFILKVDPTKKMLFNPKESIDFNGNTGPFIQYTYARINSLRAKALEAGIDVPSQVGACAMNEKELELVKILSRYPETIREAGEAHSPGVIANYVYELVKEYNQFYHDYSIMKEENAEVRAFRLALSGLVARVIKSGMGLLGISVPERM